MTEHVIVTAVSEALLQAGRSGERGRRVLVFDDGPDVPVEVCATPGRLARVASPAVLMAARDELAAIADRLRVKARETGDKTHFGTAAGVSLACVKLIEIADKIGSNAS